MAPVSPKIAPQEHVLDMVVRLGQEAEIPTSTLQLLPKVYDCESGLRQDATNTNPAYYDRKGNFHATTTDVGIAQLNSVHWKEAAAMGYDIFTEQGNIGYSLYLIKKNGLRDYSASQSCWQS